MYIHLRRFHAPVILIVIFIVGSVTIPAFAATKSTTSSSTVSAPVTQSYNAGSSVLPSMLVEYKQNDKKTVVPLTTTDIGKMVGVVIPPTNATIVLSPQSDSDQQVLVAPSGQYNILVNNQNGAIKSGDYLTISSLSGVAMLATSSNPLIIGRALSSFNGTNPISTSTLVNPSGKSIEVGIGRIPANIQLAPNPLYLKNSNSILVFLTRAEYNITNKAVSPIRTYLSGVIALATILITIVVLYSGTRTAIISVSRNPLAKSAINRNMTKTIISGLMVFIIGTIAVYLLLNK
jgi:hypothetical protein